VSQEDKDRQHKRWQRASRHWQTYEQQRELDAARKARPPKRERPRTRDGEAEFEPIRRRERALPKNQVAPPQQHATAETRALVVALTQGRAQVLDHEGERSAVLAPELVQAQQTAIAVGDEVLLHERAGGAPLVHAVLARRSELARTDPHHGHRRRVLAANVDLVVLVLDAGRLRAGLIDRLRLAVEGSGATLAVAVNKCDAPHDPEELAAELAPHRAAGVPVVLLSALTGDGIDALRALVRGRTCVFVGHSGVGKSTLLNRLDPLHERATAAVRADDRRGRHTTSASRLWVLGDGTRLIDTPGVRAFGLDDGACADDAFPEVAALAAGCRFRDCAHAHEPGCAVRAAVEAGTLPAERFAAYAKLRAAGPGHQPR
jgi:ribosome biogenesis GTPase